MIKTLLVGSGSVGALKPSNIDSMATKNIFTHAHAIKNNPAFELIGIVDKDINKAKKACVKWGVSNYYSDVKEVKEEIDLAVCAVDTKYHAAVMIDLISLKPKRIICEKPCTENLDAFLLVNRLCVEYGIILDVNYNRYFIPELERLQRLLSFSEIQNINVRYCRGFKRDGCHALAFLCGFLGKFKDATFFLTLKQILDNEDDSTISVMLRFEKCDNVIFQGCDGNNFSIFEITILTNNEKISITSHSKYINYSVAKKTEFGNFKALEEVEYKLKTGLNNYLVNLYDSIAKGEVNGTKFIAEDVHIIYKYLGI